MIKLRTLCLSALLVMFLVDLEVLAADSQNLPQIGDAASGIISLDKEYEIGQDFLRSLRAQAPTLNDPILQDYLENLIYHLASFSQLQDRRLDVVLIDSPLINAFAVPGGIVGINHGLFSYGETEQEISAILAHELAHLSQRHFARSVEAGKKSSVISLAGLLASIVLMTTVGSDVGLAVLSTSQGIAQSKHLSHSRAREAEADRVGIDTLVDAGKDPRAMAYMFERLQRANRFSDDRMPEFLRTHPVTKSRIADAYNQTRNYPTKTWPLNLNYQLMRARVSALTTKSPRETILRFKAGLRERDAVKKDAAQYGLVLTLLENTQLDEATRFLRPLLEKYSDSILFRIAEADIHSQAGRYDQALEILEASLAVNTGNYPITMAYAETLLSAGRPKDAGDLLVALSVERRNDEHLWYLLAEAYGLGNDIPGVHQARAEFFVLIGNFDQAIKQLGFALPLVRGNFQQDAKIKQRIEEIWKLKSDLEKP